MQDAIRRAAGELRGAILRIGRALHERPELSLEEHRSAALLGDALAAAGFEVEAGVAELPTAFVARRGTGGPPRIAILAEYDALPGIGHGCGHNLIAAVGVGAGLVLARAAQEAAGGRLPGTLLVVGTPAEETIGGKCVMVERGVFDGVDAAMMVHGASEWRVNVDSLACVSLEITYLGRASHAVAWPEKGINALDALIQLFVAIELLRKRLGAEVRIPGVVREGGDRPNIVPARAVGAFSLRAPSTARLLDVRAAVERAARSIAEGTGCGIEIRQTDRLYDDMLTNRALAERFAEHLGGLGVVPVDGPRPNRGSLDMGNVSRVVPSIHPFMSVAPPEIALHSAGFAAATIEPRADAAVMTAVTATALTAFDAMTDGALLAAAAREFAAAAPGGRPA